MAEGSSEGRKNSTVPLWVVVLVVVLGLVLCGAPAGGIMGAIVEQEVDAQSCGGGSLTPSPSQTGQTDLTGSSHIAGVSGQVGNESSLIWSTSLHLAQQFVASQHSTTTNPLTNPSTISLTDAASTVAKTGLVAIAKGPVPTPTIPGTECGIDPNGNAIVAWALAITAHLYPCPTSTSMDVCYDSGMPKAVIQYWQHTCPGCSQWQEGNLQCVMTVLAAYGLGGSPAPVVRGNAIGFWLNYASIPGWVEIPSLFAPGSVTTLAAPSARGLPLPGDMIVFFISWDAGVGHVGVVVKVTPPTPGHLGSLVFAEANGPTPLFTVSVNPDLTVNIPWAGYFVTGYVRYIGQNPTPKG